ncbi:uncharacterized protein LOC120333649 isoform X2 [Styela clava]
MAKKRCTWCRTNAVIRCVRDIPLSYGGVRPVDNCIQTAPTERVRCTAPGNFELCRKKGCHFCQNEKPKCIEGRQWRSFGVSKMQKLWLVHCWYSQHRC